MGLKRIKSKRMKGSKRGALTLPAVLIGGAMFIAGLFFMVDMPLKLIITNELVDTVTNSASAGVTNINEDLVRYGDLIINENKAKDAALNMFKSTYNLDDTLKPNEDGESESRLHEVKNLSVQVYNKGANFVHVYNMGTEATVPYKQVFDTVNVSKDGKVLEEGSELEGGSTPKYFFTVPNSEGDIKIPIEESSVMVYADVIFSRQTRAKDGRLNITRHSISEVSFPKSK